MSSLYGKWNVDDVRDVIRSLDEKTGMNGAELHIWLSRSLGDGSTLGQYHPGSNNLTREFSFSLKYFNDKKFNDLAVIDVIRHEYCHYIVDALNLKKIYQEEASHGRAWKTTCGLLNTDQDAHFCSWYFPKPTEDSFMKAYLSEDIKSVDIIEQIERWGLSLPSLNRRKYLEKALIKKYTKLRIFSIGDYVIHSTFGYGRVLDTLPCANKQYLYAQFEHVGTRIVQNRYVYKVINGEIKRPVSKSVMKRLYTDFNYISDEANVSI